jgi:molybdate transport system permease protein
MSHASRPSSGLFKTGVTVAVVFLLLLLILPLVAMLVRVPSRSVLEGLTDPAVLQALRLSLITSLAATGVVVLLGLPAAYLMATRDFRGKRIVESLIDLPLVLPPTVAGLALLLAFGRAGLAGRALSPLGLQIPFTTLAVVIAQTFMALPLFVGAARAGFSSIEPRYLDAADTLRASEGYRFWRIMLPLAAPSLIAGTAMTWARALGEFGATITFAGNLPGVTQTMPLAVYTALQTNLDAAIALSLVLMATSLTLLILLRSRRVGLLLGRVDAVRAAP